MLLGTNACLNCAILKYFENKKITNYVGKYVES